MKMTCLAVLMSALVLVGCGDRGPQKPNPREVRSYRVKVICVTFQDATGEDFETTIEFLCSGRREVRNDKLGEVGQEFVVTSTRGFAEVYPLGSDVIGNEAK